MSQQCMYMYDSVTYTVKVEAGVADVTLALLLVFLLFVTRLTLRL